MEGQSAEPWLRTNEIEEMVDALEHSAELAAGLGTKLTRWKWLILSMHTALQGACVCALRGHDTAGIAMLNAKSARAVWHWLDVESRKTPAPPMPVEKLARMLDLFDRVCDVNYLPHPHCLVAHGQMIDDVRKLNSLRNQFTHFVPMGLALGLGGMPRIIRHCCDAIEHLAVSEPTFSHHLNEAMRSRIRAALSGLRRAMDEWASLHGVLDSP